MAALRFDTLDVFTQTALCGNPLAVVLGADRLSSAQMQRIAREFNLSETVFVLPAEHADAIVRLRIFTPLEELPFAGHPNIGTACLLAARGMVPSDDEAEFIFEEGIGLVPVKISSKPGQVLKARISAVRAPVFLPEKVDTDAIAAVLGLDTHAMADPATSPAMTVNCGLPMLLAPLRAPEHLAGISLDASALPKLLQANNAHSLYVYAAGYEGEMRCRMFSPGIGEDPATGSAAMALGARLARDSAQDTQTLTVDIRQGVEMRRPSEIEVTVEKQSGQISAVHLAGCAVQVMEGHIDIG